MFFRLGATNASRNLTRSLFAILSMAVAAAVLTSALSTSRGYPAGGYLPFRRIFGGEIIVYPVKFTGQLPRKATNQKWELSPLQPHATSDLPVLRPEFLTTGLLSQSAAELRPFTEGQIKELVDQPGIRGAYPYYLIPAMTASSQYTGVYHQSPLRGRDIAKDQEYGFSDPVMLSGRYFTPEDEGQPVAVVSGWQFLPQSVKIPQAGSKIRVEIPAVQLVDGQLVFDYSQRIAKELTVVGQTKSLTRTVSYKDKTGMDQIEEMFWHSSEVEIPLSTWKAWFKEAGGGEYLPQELALHVPDMTYLEDTVASLAARFPQYSFISTPKHATTAIIRGLVDKTYKAPPDAVGAKELPHQSGIPLDLRRPLLVMIYVNAALMMAANMLITVNERRREMGVLKSVGARRKDIMIMALSEAVMISAIGGTAGFLAVRIFGAINQITNNYPVLAILRSVVADYGLAIGLTVTLSLLFGMIPAVRLSKMTAMQALRGE
ncbi:MAG: FtsX-like permease family protein [Bacillota bacterium]